MAKHWYHFLNSSRNEFFKELIGSSHDQVEILSSRNAVNDNFVAVRNIFAFSYPNYLTGEHSFTHVYLVN